MILEVDPVADAAYFEISPDVEVATPRKSNPTSMLTTPPTGVSSGLKCSPSVRALGCRVWIRLY